MPSFDTVSKADLEAVKNSIIQAEKIINTRFDFKGTSARVELKERDISIYADSDFQLDQVRDVVTDTFSKRKFNLAFLDHGNIEKIGGDKLKQVIKIKNGIESDAAKKIVRLVKDSKLKVQASIQGDAVRITGAKRDDLQEAQALLLKEVKDLPLTFDNYRD
ncbi:YajQ family cyclic di-GMP-binding protein [Herminiimonas sp. KBW02]|uniref:YajQ family cyclic di-GMP-binding protein n=1 Tax=Herminiimonas sp. KBW02 TaxID=2153363 RepID=UPI000F597933|nr:YajQ family cyclic di-GMP-binding protein [Herminiimonas sp. KBW02]RQO35814.1 YajQ family cyclic di-GMP-binding protein [Herminiimonas sp. KBW02]